VILGIVMKVENSKANTFFFFGGERGYKADRQKSGELKANLTNTPSPSLTLPGALGT